MLSDTLVEGLNEHRIGPKIRALRQAKELGLAQLAAHTGLSTALLSKIERGHNFPTLPTLLRIAMVFGVGLDHFFIEPEKPAVALTRAADRVRLPDRPGSSAPSFLFESLNFPLQNRSFEAYLAHFPARRSPTEPHTHSGTELLYLVEGTLEVTIGADAYRLEAGDAISFDATAPHRYGAPTRTTARAMVITIA